MDTLNLGHEQSLTLLDTILNHRFLNYSLITKKCPALKIRIGSSFEFKFLLHMSRICEKVD